MFSLVSGFVCIISWMHYQLKNEVKEKFLSNKESLDETKAAHKDDVKMLNARIDADKEDLKQYCAKTDDTLAKVNNTLCRVELIMSTLEEKIK